MQSLHLVALSFALWCSTSSRLETWTGSCTSCWVQSGEIDSELSLWVVMCLFVSVLKGSINMGIQIRGACCYRFRIIIPFGVLNHCEVMGCSMLSNLVPYWFLWPRGCRFGAIEFIVLQLGCFETIGTTANIVTHVVLGWFMKVEFYQATSNLILKWTVRI